VSTDLANLQAASHDRLLNLRVSHCAAIGKRVDSLSYSGGLL
jgi:hypothetical protein